MSIALQEKGAKIKVIVIDKILAFRIGVDEAIVYSEYLSKYFYYESMKMLNADGSFCCTVNELEVATTFKEKKQRKINDKLIELGLIKITDCGKRYVKPTLDEKLIKKYSEEGEEAIRKIKEKQKLYDYKNMRKVKKWRENHY